jgi:hypothetical protein
MVIACRGRRHGRIGVSLSMLCVQWISMLWL